MSMWRWGWKLRRFPKVWITATTPGMRSLSVQIARILEEVPSRDAETSALPRVIMVVGVNGTGKTTTIAKLAHMHKSEGKEVVLAAADTFRAAAIEQLGVWCKSYTGAVGPL
jgi:signal recognition particle GTPase